MTLANEVARRIDACAGDMLAFTRELIRIPTENPPGRNYPECAARIAAELRTLDLAPRQLEVPPGRRPRRDSDAAAADLPRQVVLGECGEGRRALYFHGHYDVVPAISPDQFEPRVRGDSLFGRGSSDMKSGVAAMIYAAHALKASGARLHGRVALTLVPDEETGGARGSRYLASRGLLGRDGIGMLTAEPTSGAVWNACRGALTLRLTVKGRAAHVGLQHQGINAFERMLPIASAMIDLKRRVERRATRYALRPAAARRSILLVGGRSEAGTNFNLVPATCSLTVDRRFNPEESLEVERRRLLAVVDRFRRRGTAVSVERLQEGRACGAPSDHPVAVALAASVRDVAGRSPRFEMCPGLLEIRFYAARGVPGFAYGPGVLAVSHGPQEFVKLGKIRDCALIYALTALRVLGR